MNISGDSRLYRRLLQYVAPYRPLFVLALFAMIVLAAADAGKAALLKPMLDGAFIENDPELMVSIPLYLIGLFMISGLATFVAGASLQWVANRIVLDLRETMFMRLLAFPSRFYDTHNTGAIVSKFTYDVMQIKEASTNALTVLVKDSLVIIGLLAWMLYLDWFMTLITLLSAPFILLVVLFIRKRLRNMSHKVQNSMASINHILNESINAHKIIKLFNGQQQAIERFYDAINANRKFTMKFVNASIASGPAVQLIASVALALIVYYAARQAGAGEMTVGTFVSFFTALVMMLDALKRLVKVNEFIQKGLAGCESIFSIMDEKVEVDQVGGDPVELEGVIEIRNLSFSYDDKNQVLSDISVQINPGETVALVGASGSGKTTLANLLPRFYPITAGSILIDGWDITAIPLVSLRRNIALVSQDIVLFDDTVRNNIAYGAMRAATDEQVRVAARAAHALDFIERLPEGMNTILGEHGMRLSGGQRQRISLARALLKNSPVLILDEATSALDSESERNIQQALERIRHKHTCVVIAHRLSTIETADRIIVLDEGRIAEIGRHDELINRGGLYAQYYSTRDFFVS